MQWSYQLRSTILATTSKFKMAVEIGVFRLIREALYFCSMITATTSKFCWELQIDVSFIYWLILLDIYSDISALQIRYYSALLQRCPFYGLDIINVDIKIYGFFSKNLSKFFNLILSIMCRSYEIHINFVHFFILYLLFIIWFFWE